MAAMMNLMLHDIDPEDVEILIRALHMSLIILDNNTREALNPGPDRPQLSIEESTAIAESSQARFYRMIKLQGAILAASTKASAKAFSDEIIDEANKTNDADDEPGNGLNSPSKSNGKKDK